LKRQLLIENPSAYLRFDGDVLEEPEFLRLLAARTGCGLLLDVNNVFVSAANLGFDAKAYLGAFPFEAVKEIHLAGHTTKKVQGETILIDDHGSRVSTSVLSLYADTLGRAREAATLIEWDSEIPAFNVLLEERDRAAAAAVAALTPKPAPGLAALQAEIARALLSGAPNPTLAITGHFSVHRNNVRESLTTALRTAYAGVEQLVGEAFFRQSAQQFIAGHPPRMASLAGYGEEFPEFLSDLSSCDGLPYLTDVARPGMAGEPRVIAYAVACPVRRRPKTRAPEGAGAAGLYGAAGSFLSRLGLSYGCDLVVCARRRHRRRAEAR